MASLTARLSRLGDDIPPSQIWKEAIETGYQTKGLEQANEDFSSRHWIDHPPRNGPEETTSGLSSFDRTTWQRLQFRQIPHTNANAEVAAAAARPKP